MKTRKKYSKEFKLDAITLVNEEGYSRAEAASNLVLARVCLVGRLEKQKKMMVMLSEIMEN